MQLIRKINEWSIKTHRVNENIFMLINSNESGLFIHTHTFTIEKSLCLTNKDPQWEEKDNS